MVSRETKDYLGITGLIGFFLIISIVVPFIVGFSAKGFDTTETIMEYTIYAAIAVSFLAIFVFWLYAKRLNSQYGNNLFFASKGEQPSLGFFKRFTYPQLILGSTIVFGALFLVVSQIRQTAFTGFTTLQQQFSPGASVVFSAFLVPAPENAVLAAFIAGLAILLINFARKNNWSRSVYNGFVYLIIPALGGLLGLSMHLLRYGSSDWDLYIVFAFWFIVALLDVASGAFVIGWVLHVMNNLFFDLKVYLSSETVFLYGIVILFVLTIIYFIIYKDKLLGSNQEL